MEPTQKCLEQLKLFQEWQRERARTKKPSLLDKVGIRDIEIPDEMQAKDEPNARFRKNTIGNYTIKFDRIDFRKQKYYFITVNNDTDDDHGMMRYNDFEEAARVYLSLEDYLKKQSKQDEK